MSNKQQKCQLYSFKIILPDPKIHLLWPCIQSEMQINWFKHTVAPHSNKKGALNFCWKLIDLEVEKQFALKANEISQGYYGDGVISLGVSGPSPMVSCTSISSCTGQWSGLLSLGMGDRLTTPNIICNGLNVTTGGRSWWGGWGASLIYSLAVLRVTCPHNLLMQW